ncbi:hypothetical protein AVEN_215075-1 [Araneus ventricosus]|uniref:Uncharacterized protein n=1 Tax=Araneus ventricosus TaxID=182803 RepID=A0A4Y2GW35_ARAVE|nr:hypothetical protein AVEN_54086-1 [Araneus ventricosus]GBM57990.1 hypothetical protein AVEN_264145-1 [Araneus ventricosus]GBM58008.1 hypothetical protein AVEN_48213-1 [Araneus ventricosus]GBM58048.1 hypothetical protein AVEN_215075-1 [Araneus ventricosus]
MLQIYVIPETQHLLPTVIFQQDDGARIFEHFAGTGLPAGYPQAYKGSPLGMRRDWITALCADLEESVMQGLRKQLSRNEDTDAKPFTTQVQLGIAPRHLSASTLTH